MYRRRSIVWLLRVCSDELPEPSAFGKKSNEASFIFVSCSDHELYKLEGIEGSESGSKCQHLKFLLMSTPPQKRGDNFESVYSTNTHNVHLSTANLVLPLPTQVQYAYLKIATIHPKGKDMVQCDLQCG